jgi:hypothetical protein
LQTRPSNSEILAFPLAQPAAPIERALFCWRRSSPRRILVNGLQLRQVTVGDSSNVPSPVRSGSRTDPKKALAHKAVRKAGLEGKRGFLLEGSEGLSPFLFLADNPRVAVSFSGASASSLEPRSAKRKVRFLRSGLPLPWPASGETRERLGRESGPGEKTNDPTVSKVVIARCAPPLRAYR